MLILDTDLFVQSNVTKMISMMYSQLYGSIEMCTLKNKRRMKTQGSNCGGCTTKNMEHLTDQQQKKTTKDHFSVHFLAPSWML